MRVKKVYTIRCESSRTQSEVIDKFVEAVFSACKELHPKIEYSISIMSNEKQE